MRIMATSWVRVEVAKPTVRSFNQCSTDYDPVVVLEWEKKMLFENTAR